jgi:hypothetical protein
MRSLSLGSPARLEKPARSRVQRPQSFPERKRRATSCRATAEREPVWARSRCQSKTKRCPDVSFDHLSATDGRHAAPLPQRHCSIGGAPRRADREYLGRCRDRRVRQRCRGRAVCGRDSAGNCQSGFGPNSRAPDAVSHRHQSRRCNGGRFRHLWRRGQHRSAAAKTRRARWRRSLRFRLRSGAQQTPLGP